MEKAVVLASGGINSTVAAAVAREQYEPALMHVAWGHRAAERERAAFDEIAGHLKIAQTLVTELPGTTLFGANARTSRRMAIEDASALTGETPNTFVLGLLPTMLSLATAWASTIGAKRIIVGISEDHGVPGPTVSELYPDHRPEFLQTFNLMLEYGTPANRHPIIDAPMMELTRAEVITLGRRAGVNLAKTWSCYRSNDKPCGKCRACATRAAGFLRAGIPDPLMLEPANDKT